MKYLIRLIKELIRFIFSSFLYIFQVQKIDFNLLVGEWKMIKIVERSIFESETNTASGSSYFVTISLNEDKPETNDNLDNLIYSFNNNSITVNNWISLRSFINKILSSYPG